MTKENEEKPKKNVAKKTDIFSLRKEAKPNPELHVFGKQNVICDTDRIGHVTPRGDSPLRIVVDATEGFVPLWAKNVTLRWRFRPGTLEAFQHPTAVRNEVERLFGEALLAWGDAVPVKFKHQEDGWDFEIVLRRNPDCDASGCVLASAFFPDSGRHQLEIYPTMFQQSEDEQLETLIHEIGHVFGLRHFFANISETPWASEIFGEHSKFTIMNYGANSILTDNDKSDLKRLYQLAWNGTLTNVNGTPIRLVQPFHTIGEPTDNIFALREARTVVYPEVRAAFA
jgi:hypothetical protein